MYSRDQHAAFTRSISLEVNNPAFLFTELVQEKLRRIEEIILKKISFDEIFDAIQTEIKTAYLSSPMQQAIVRGVKRFVNSRDCTLEKRYQKQVLFLDVSWVSETGSFKVFNSRMDRLIDSLDPDNKTEIKWQHRLKTGVSGVLNFVHGCIQYAAEHPLQTVTLILLSQAVLADTKRTADAVINVNNTVDLDYGLKAYFPFNGTALDVSGNHNNGTVVGAIPSIDRFGTPDNAYYFNGTGYIIGDSSNLPSNERSVSMWIKPTLYDYSAGRNGGGLFFGYGGNAPCGTSFITVLNNLCATPPNSFDIQAHCAVNRVLYINNSLANTLMNRWSLFTYTTDSSEGSKVYLNGTLVLQTPSVFLNNTYVFQKNFAIGTGVSPMGMAPYQDSCAFNFIGVIDEVRIYNRSLNEDEVLSLYNETSKPLPTTPSPTPIITTTAPVAPNVTGTPNVTTVSPEPTHKNDTITPVPIIRSHSNTFYFVGGCALGGGVSVLIGGSLYCFFKNRNKPTQEETNYLLEAANKNYAARAMTSTV